MNFSEALYALKAGARVVRAGWNGRDMWIVLVPAFGWGVHLTLPGRESTDEIPLLPFIAMKTADHKLVPWLASQTDLLADDWRPL